MGLGGMRVLCPVPPQGATREGTDHLCVTVLISVPAADWRLVLLPVTVVSERTFYPG